MIDGSFLSPVDLGYAPELTNQTVTVPITSVNGAVLATLAAKASAADALSYKIISGNLSNTFALDPISGALSVADNSAFAAYAVSNFTLIVEAQDSGYGGLFPPKSTLATITLPVVDNSPVFDWTGNGADNNWSTAGNWNGTLPNDHSKLTFLGVGQKTNQNNFLDGAGLVTLAGSGYYLAGNPLLLRAGLWNQGNNTWAIDSILGGPQAFNSSYGTLVISGSIKNAGNLLTVEGNRAVRLDGMMSGGGGLDKSGSGTLTISSGNTYTGPTVINSGTLALVNSGLVAASSRISVQAQAVLDVSGASPVYTIPPGQSLGGNGTVVGPIVIAGTLAPASQGPFLVSPPAMVFSNGLVLAGNVVMEISGASADNQSIRVAGELDFGGTLTVLVLTNGSEPLGVTETFKLFDAQKFAGSFSQFNLPQGFRWDTSQLATNGTIRIAALAPVTVPFLPPTYAHGRVVIRFQSVLGRSYTLESAPSLTPPVRWTSSVPRVGTGGVIAITLTVPETAPQRFFRLISN